MIGQKLINMGETCLIWGLNNLINLFLKKYQLSQIFCLKNALDQTLGWGWVGVGLWLGWGCGWVWVRLGWGRVEVWLGLGWGQMWQFSIF